MKKLIFTIAIGMTIASLAKADSGAGSANGDKASGAFSSDDHLGAAIITDYLHDKYFDREATEQDRWQKWGEKRLDFDRQVFKEMLAACKEQNARHRAEQPLASNQ